MINASSFHRFLSVSLVYSHPYRKLGLDLVIRDDEGGILNPTEQSTVHLYRLHETAQTRIGQQEKSVSAVFTSKWQNGILYV